MTEQDRTERLLRLFHGLFNRLVGGKRRQRR